MRGRDLNRPCECGSGLKAKKCCETLPPRPVADTRSPGDKARAAMKAKRDRADAVKNGEIPKA